VSKSMSRRQVGADKQMRACVCVCARRWAPAGEQMRVQAPGERIRVCLCVCACVLGLSLCVFVCTLCEHVLFENKKRMRSAKHA